MSITDYNKKIAELVLESVHKYIESEDRIKRGGGCYRSERPKPIMGVMQPDILTPSNSVSGGKIRVPKVLKKIGKETVHIVAPVAKKAAEKLITKLADKAVDSAINYMSQSGETGAGIKRRGRPKKSDQNIEGGKLNFVKSLKRVGSKVANAVGTVAVSKAIDCGVKALTNPAVDESLAEGAEMAAVAAAGIKRKRKPTSRNIAMGKLMKQGMSMKQANEQLRKLKK